MKKSFVLFFLFLLTLTSCSNSGIIDVSLFSKTTNEIKKITPDGDGSVLLIIPEKIVPSASLQSCNVVISRNSAPFDEGGCSDLLTGFTYDPSSSALNWTALFGDYGTYEFTLEMFIGGATREVKLTIELMSRNTVPQITNNQAITINQGDNLELPLIGYDPDIATQSDALSYTCKTCPVGMSIDGSNIVRMASGSITESPFTFVIEVADLFGGKADKTFTVTVTGFSGGGGSGPSVPTIPKYSVEEGTMFTLPFSVIYPEGTSSTTYTTPSCFPACTGAMMNQAAIFRRFQWTPANFTNGVYLITFGVNGSPDFTHTIELTVTDKNFSPAWGSFTTTLREFFHEVPDEIIFPVTDPENDALTLSCHVINLATEAVVTELSPLCSSLSSIDFSSADKKMTIDVDESEVGSYKFMVVASDGTSMASRTFNINLRKQVPLDIEVNILAGNLSYTPPMTAGGGYLSCDTGLQASKNSDMNPVCTYASAGMKRIKFYGKATVFNSNSASAASRERLIKVNSLGELGYTNLEYALYGTINLETFTSGPVLPTFTKMRGMFSYSGVKEVNLDGFNASGVTDVAGAERMFYATKSLETVTFLGSDFSKVKSFTEMFAGFPDESTVRQVDFENLDVSSVEKMNGFLSGAKFITEVNFGNKVFSELTTLEGAFGGAINNSAGSVKTNFNFSNTSFPKLTTLESSFGGRHYENINFSGASFPKLTTMKSAFDSSMGDKTKGGVRFVGASFPVLLNMSELFYRAGGFEVNFSGVEFSKVNNLDSAFGSLSGTGRGFDTVDFSGAKFPELTVLKQGSSSSVTVFQDSIGVIDFSNAEFPKLTRTDYMFSSVKGRMISFENADLSKVTNAKSMFFRMDGITNSERININFKNANFSSLLSFGGSWFNQSGDYGGVIDFSGANFSSVSDASSLFENLNAVEIRLNGLILSSNVNLTKMFYYVRDTEILDASFLSDITGTINVSEMMRYAFYSNPVEIAKVNLAKFDEDSKTYVSPDKAKMTNTTNLFSDDGTSSNYRFELYCDYGSNGSDPYGDFFGIPCHNPADF